MVARGHCEVQSVAVSSGGGSVKPASSYTASVAMLLPVVDSTKSVVPNSEFNRWSLLAGTSFRLASPVFMELRFCATSYVDDH